MVIFRYTEDEEFLSLKCSEFGLCSVNLRWITDCLLCQSVEPKNKQFQQMLNLETVRIAVEL